MANFHKRFVALNLKSEKGLEVMMKLLAEADVFITNTRTKSLAKMGLDWESLHEKFPRLIMGHGLGYGKKAPKRTLPALTLPATWAAAAFSAPRLTRATPP